MQEQVVRVTTHVRESFAERATPGASVLPPEQLMIGWDELAAILERSTALEELSLDT